MIASTMTSRLPIPMPHVLATSVGRGWKALDADLVHIPKGRTQATGGASHVLGMHFGAPVRADCIIGGVRVRGVQRPGDLSLVPAGADGAWEDDAACRILRLSLRPTLFLQVAEDLGVGVAGIDLQPRLQFRDARIEAIGWAIKADLEAETPSNALFIDSVSNALAVRLIEIATTRQGPSADGETPKLSERQSRRLLAFIEANLAGTLRLADLASLVGLSPTRFKMSFRNSIGMPVHQYVIRRRVEYARALLATTRMPAIDIALTAGFAHQSHMTTTMRRILGLTPSTIPRPADEIEPNLQTSVQT